MLRLIWAKTWNAVQVELSVLRTQVGDMREERQQLRDALWLGTKRVKELEGQLTEVDRLRDENARLINATNRAQADADALRNEREDWTHDKRILQEQLTNAVNGQLSSDRFLAALKEMNIAIPTLRVALGDLGVEVMSQPGVRSPKYRVTGWRKVGEAPELPSPGGTRGELAAHAESVESGKKKK